MRCIFLLTGIAVLLLTGCTSTPQDEKYYYTLSYDPRSETPELMQNAPIQGRVWVRDAFLSRSYSRKQIVVRHFGPRISYLDNHLWANALDKKVPELIIKRLEAYNLFSEIRRDFPYTRPEYEMVTTITTLEFRRGEGTPEVVLNLRFDLRQLEGENIVTTKIERTIPVYDKDIGSFVQVVNKSILDAADRFAMDVLAAFGREELEAEDWETHPLTRKEATTNNIGQLLLPSVFTGREAPVYTIVDSSGNSRLGTFGTPEPLSPGRYTIRYGSGTLKQQMLRNVRVREGYRTIVEPDYGGLKVEIVTTAGKPVELAYEIFDSATGSSYGTGYSSEGLAKWDERNWILPTGRYKITINNRPFTSNRDFAAAYVEKGEGNILTIAVTQSELGSQYRVAGAGVVKEPLYAEEDERWILASSIAGNIIGTLTNQEEYDDYSSGFTLNGFLENRLRYDYAPFNLSLYNRAELGATRSEAGSFEITRDNLEFESTGIVDVLFNLGLYLNFDASTHVFNSYYRADEPFSFEKYNAQGDLIHSESGVEKVQTASPLLPATFREGTGINIALVEKPRLDSSARFGFGMRQRIYGSSFPEVDTSGSMVVLRRKENEYSTGLEASLQLSTQLLQELTYSSRFDAYAPFIAPEEFNLEWHHDLQLSLWRNFTLDYRATLYNTKNANDLPYIGSDHAVYLRFSTIYRVSF